MQERNRMVRRVLMTLCGVLIAGWSVGMFQYSMLGMDPFQVFAHGIWNQILHILSGRGIRLLTAADLQAPAIGYGPVYMVINFLLLIVDWFLDRRKIGIATFLNLFLVGYVVDLSYGVWVRLMPSPSLPVRALFLLVAIVIMCLASALYFTGDLGVSTYDAIALALSEQKGWDFRIVRISTDLVCTGLGTLMGVFPGVGTLITAFFMGPLIEFFNVHVARPLLAGSPSSSGGAGEL